MSGCFNIMIKCQYVKLFKVLNQGWGFTSDVSIPILKANDMDSWIEISPGKYLKVTCKWLVETHCNYFSTFCFYGLLVFVNNIYSYEFIRVFSDNILGLFFISLFLPRILLYICCFVINSLWKDIMFYIISLVTWFFFLNIDCFWNQYYFNGWYHVYTYG